MKGVFTDRNDYLRGVPELHRSYRGRGGVEELEQRRSLGGGDGGGDLQSLLVDKDGVEYDPNSLAWRYLGLYVDCDDRDDNGSGSGDYGGQEDGGGYCQRKLLWAAYLDKRYKQYRGNGIGDYQIYDVTSGGYDGTSCDGYGSSRCAKLDCHEPGTNFELLGVLKETKGMYDWTEQLFKHEGVCIWNDDEVYETMKTWMEKWPRECQALDVTDNRGNAIYLDIKPLPGGDMTLAIYKDSICSKVSSNMDFAAYTVKLYKSLGYNRQTGSDVAQTYKEAIDTWNEKMNTFKVCQPCVAYNLHSGQGKNNGHGRALGGNQGDGEERQMYNCYDDAGYTNVNQCYKFGSKTELEVSDEYDLITASSQGTILRIKANGKVYGKGGYKASGTSLSLSLNRAFVSAAAIAFLAFTALLFRRILIRRRQQRSRLRRKLWRRKSREGGGTGRKAKKKGKNGKATTKRGGGKDTAWDDETAESLSIGDDAMIARHHSTAGTYNPPPPPRDGRDEKRRGVEPSRGIVVEDAADHATNRRGGRRDRSSSRARSSSRDVTSKGRRPAPNDNWTLTA